MSSLQEDSGHEIDEQRYPPYWILYAFMTSVVGTIFADQLQWENLLYAFIPCAVVSQLVWAAFEIRYRLRISAFNRRQRKNGGDVP